MTNEHLHNFIINAIVEYKQNEAKTKVLAHLKTAPSNFTLLGIYIDEYTSVKDIQSWIISFFQKIRDEQEETKKKLIASGIGIIVFSIIITLVSFLLSSISNGKSFVFASGAFIAGIIQTIRGSSIEIIEIPDFKESK